MKLLQQFFLLLVRYKAISKSIAQVLESTI